MPSVSEPSWRVLVALLVYNGEEFVGPCLSSLARLDPGPHSADVLVLDDASPNPGWSDRCREMTTDLGFGYYRTPRNLGIPRNMNLGMLRAVDAGYDAVILLNSDTILPANLIPTLLRPLIEDESASSSYCVVEQCQRVLHPQQPAGSSGRRTPDHRLDIRADGRGVRRPGDIRPVGRRVLHGDPHRVIKDVGLMDPVFGRGYSEEIDWCLRSHTLGYKSVLAPSCFVYHAGSGITKVEGSIGDGDRTVDAHQAIIDQRYPLYVSQLIALPASSIIDGMRERGLRRIIISAARERGYRLETSRLNQHAGDHDVVRFRIDPDGTCP